MTSLEKILPYMCADTASILYTSTVFDKRHGMEGGTDGGTDRGTDGGRDRQSKL